jgi:hypothetical protein
MKYYVESWTKRIPYKQYKKDKRIGHNCLLKHVIQGKIKGRIHEEEDIKQPLDNTKKKRG